MMLLPNELWCKIIFPFLFKALGSRINNCYSIKVKLATKVEGDPNAPFFNNYYTAMLGTALFLSPDCSTLPLTRTLRCWVLSKEVPSTIFQFFGMSPPGNEYTIFKLEKKDTILLLVELLAVTYVLCILSHPIW